MPRVCFYRPNRTFPRHYTARDAGRIICYARQNGATYGEILDAARERGCLEDQDCDCVEFKRFIETFLEALAGALIALALPETLLLRLALPGLRVLAKLLPGSTVAQLVRAIEGLTETKAVLGELKALAQEQLKRLP